MIAHGERAEELRLALQGQLFDILGQEESKNPEESNTTKAESTAPAITEEIALEIFEKITRQSLEQQNMAEGSEDPQGELLNVLVHNAKMMDQIYIEYQLELKDFQAAIHQLVAVNPAFEERIIQKESEIMDDSV